MATTQIRRDTSTKNKVVSSSRKAKAKKMPTGDAFSTLGVVPEWSQLPELVELDFGKLAEQRQRLDDEIKFRTAKKKELDEQIEAMFAAAGTEKVQWEGRSVQIVHSKSGDRIIGEKLLMLGVPAGTIAEATEIGKPYEYLLFGKPDKG